jgi:hypothetical protein
MAKVNFSFSCVQVSINPGSGCRVDVEVEGAYISSIIDSIGESDILLNMGDTEDVLKAVLACVGESAMKQFVEEL